MQIKLIKKTAEAASKVSTFELEVRGDKVGGFNAPEIYDIANGTDIQLYILSGDPKGSYEMLPVTSTETADAWNVDIYDPSEYGDGDILVVGKAIAPWPTNWLSVDDADRVYMDVASVSKAIKFLTT